MNSTDSIGKAAMVVSDTIQEMLTHSDGIAAWLQAGGWVGQPQDSGACPVSKVLDHRLEEAGVTDVWTTTQTEMLEVEADNWQITIVMPVQLREFVRDFDYLKYPELIDGPALVPAPDDTPYGVTL